VAGGHGGEARARGRGPEGRRREVPPGLTRTSPATPTTPLVDAGAAAPWRLLALTTLQQAGLTFTRVGLTVLVPFVREQFRLSLAQVGALFWAFDSGALLAFLPSGTLGDRRREGVVLAVGAWLTAGFIVAASVSPSFGALIVALAIAGLGYPSGQTAGSRAVMVAFPQTRRGFAMGIRQAGFSAGGLAAAFVLPGLATRIGWRPALAVGGLLLGVTGLLCWWALPSTGGARPGMSVAASLDALRRHRDFLAAAAGGSLFMVGQVAFLGFLALDLIDRFHREPVAAAHALGYVHVGGGVGRLLWGWISDRWADGRRIPILQLQALATGGILAWLAAGWPPSISTTLGPLAAGLLIQGWSGLHTTLVVELVGPSLAATAIGVMMTALYLMATLTSPAFGSLVDLSGSYAAAWGAVGGLVFLTVPLFALVNERRGDVHSREEGRAR
jgi:sugar phosphate permease